MNAEIMGQWQSRCQQILGRDWDPTAAFDDRGAVVRD